jgi:hypothetical protein
MRRLYSARFCCAATLCRADPPVDADMRHEVTAIAVALVLARIYGVAVVRGEHGRANDEHRSLQTGGCYDSPGTRL